MLGDYTIKDTVSNYFEVAQNSTKIYKVPYDYKNGSFIGGDTVNSSHQYGESNRKWGTPTDITDKIQYTENNNSVEVLASPENSSVIDTCVVDDIVDSSNEKHGGNKLRITFEIRPKDSFMGGSDVPTNIYKESGIFDKDGKAVQNFANLSATGILDTSSVPKLQVELVNANAHIDDDNVKIGYLYNLDDLGKKNLTLTYKGRYSNDEYTVKLKDSEHVVYDAAGNEVKYSESKATDENPKSVDTKPDDYAEIIIGENYIDETLNNKGIVTNSKLIQFNSTGITQTDGEYSMQTPKVNKYVYLLWKGMKTSSTYDSRNNCNAIIESATNTLIVGCKNTIIPNSVTRIGDEAFYQCTDLTNITIPDSVTSIGENAFLDCTGLISINVDDKNTVYDSRKSCNAIIETATNTLIAGCKNTVIPDDVTNIGPYAFYRQGITNIVIPKSVTSIGKSAFHGCHKLVSINISDKNTVYDSRNDCNAIIETATNTLITGCKNATIPDNVTSIGVDAFYCCTDLTDIIIPDSVTSIGSRAFEDCRNLVNIIMSNNITIIEDCTFRGCSKLTSITIPNSVAYIGASAFNDCRGLKSITIPNSVTHIGASAFSDCRNLENITIPKSVTSIGDFVFWHCTGLKRIAIPNSLIDLGFEAIPFWTNKTD